VSETALRERIFEDAYRAFARADNWRAPEDAAQTLSLLKARGYRLALLSNADGRTRDILAGLGLAPHLEQVLLSCELGYEKPDLRLFRRAEALLRADSSRILHVGDSARNDGEGPRNAGWRAVVLGREIGALGDLEALLP
jgi:putative hydrolase of the HAD superfamily